MKAGWYGKLNKKNARRIVVPGNVRRRGPRVSQVRQADDAEKRGASGRRPLPVLGLHRVSAVPGDEDAEIDDREIEIGV